MKENIETIFSDCPAVSLLRQNDELQLFQNLHLHSLYCSIYRKSIAVTKHDFGVVKGQK